MYANPDLKTQFRARSWIETTFNEIKVLLGIFSLQGIVIKPDYAIKIYKIESILQYLKIKFSSVYSPNQAIAVDESLLMWKGHLSWKQYISSKGS
ncbi:hypothetical protein J437_LFUL018273 [Ladona fulva]|uniref:PiggyBac transposable element-derived protein domain-containing protein n=1 Tax=Ladona fulva TaxID=123851 RepID=A0A8K0KPA4_LADFU|nr:hypothetical protein J437_LFUL018273 [Ladona fulva]